MRGVVRNSFGETRAFLVAGVVLGMGVPVLLGQQGQQFVPHTSPSPAFAAPENKDYNLKWGQATGRFHGSIQTEFNDNINLSRDGLSDVIFSPQVGVGFIWPISQNNNMQLDLGLGYRWYLKHSELNAVNITPDTRWHFQFKVKDVTLMVHDAFRTTIDPVERPELSGTSGNTANFRRFNNDAGIQGTWNYNTHLSFSAGYDYVIDRSLNSDFRELDRDDHTLNLGTYYESNSKLVLGITEAYTITEYLRHVQNDGTSFTVSPLATYHATDLITLDASVGYTIANFERNGTIADTSDYAGITWQVGARHTINSRMSHNLRLSRSVTPGLGSNFSEVTAFQYGFLWKVNSWIGLNSNFSYEDLFASGGLDKAQRFLTYIGFNFKMSRHWNGALSYGFAWKDSEDPSRNYTQNRVTIELSRLF
jgi:hypothetical protein